MGIHITNQCWCAVARSRDHRRRRWLDRWAGAWTRRRGSWNVAREGAGNLQGWVTSSRPPSVKTTTISTRHFCYYASLYLVSHFGCWFHIATVLILLFSFQGRSDGGYIGIYTPKSVYLKFFMWLFCLLDPGQIHLYPPKSNSWLRRYAPVSFVFVRATPFKEPKAPLLKIGSGWNLAGMFK